VQFAEHKCVHWFALQLLPETFLTLGRIKQDMIKNVYPSSSKVPVILARLKGNFNFLHTFWKHTQISNCMKICPVEAKLFYVDIQTDTTKLTVTFRNFENMPKNVMFLT